MPGHAVAYAGLETQTGFGAGEDGRAAHAFEKRITEHTVRLGRPVEILDTFGWEYYSERVVLFCEYTIEL